jgi:hypothetical protein
MDRPSIELFGKRGKNGWASQFVTTLRPGEPMPLPESYQNEKGRSAVSNAARAKNIKISTLTFAEKVWVARV